jgi:hypothetical protein
MTTFCQQCGNQLRTGGKFCQTCGAPSQPSQVAQPTTYPSNYQGEYQGNYQDEYQGNYPPHSPYQSPAAYEGYAPYPPPPSSTNWLKIFLITMTVIVALVGVSAIGVFYFVRRTVNNIVKVQEGEGGRPEVSINVPGGGQIKAGSDVTEEQLGVPIYPGAVQTKDGGSVSISGTEAGKSGWFGVAGFTTDDEVDDVVAFYRDKIGEGAQIADTEQDGKRSVVFNTQREQGWRMVSVQEDDEGKTKITIASAQGRSAQ